MEKTELVRRIKKALKYGLDTHNYDDLVAGLDSGAFQMFADDDGVVVTEIRVAPQKRYLNIILVAGELETLKNMQPRLIKFGRENGCEFTLWIVTGKHPTTHADRDWETVSQSRSEGEILHHYRYGGGYAMAVGLVESHKAFLLSRYGVDEKDKAPE